ncbi:hypothetical protein CDO73_12105 [Saccharibacillus sp. O23]|uniref:DUF695 domain-containing protein n=1 Tax=Saccharibacillus sp. O23 TaxID=2009338 RepID=UPI000B4E193E|nr:DUF695 domain-containing protein [Saccharibacillus sp. O23]OWR29826.1 hypothetical protein CDO73_12105 [Saccharibacillus sp. O23]
MSNHWDIYFSTIEEHFASIVLDMGIWKEVDQRQFSFPMALRFKIKNPNKSGIPIDREAEIINDLEDRIINEINGTGYHVGRVTTNGIRDLFFYFSQDYDLSSLAGPIFLEHGYDIETFSINEEEPWGFYFNFLYPNEYEIQHMGNRKVLESLRTSGDSLEESRRVDHWIEFRSDMDKLGFIKKVESLDFKIEQEHQSTDAITLRIYRADRVDPQSINDLTDLLVDLVNEFNARYEGWETQVIK